MPTPSPTPTQGWKSVWGVVDKMIFTGGAMDSTAPKTGGEAHSRPPHNQWRYMYSAPDVLKAIRKLPLGGSPPMVGRPSSPSATGTPPWCPSTSPRQEDQAPLWGQTKSARLIHTSVFQGALRSGRPRGARL